jgi:hypothetical protein
MIGIFAAFVIFVIAFYWWLYADSKPATAAADQDSFTEYADEGDLQNFSIRAIEDEFWRDIA